MAKSTPMFVIRRAMQSDLPTLHKLGKMVHFINLPPDKEIIADKIRNSRRSFLRAARDAKTVHKPAKDLSSGGISEKTAMANSSCHGAMQWREPFAFSSPRRGRTNQRRKLLSPAGCGRSQATWPGSKIPMPQRYWRLST